MVSDISHERIRNQMNAVRLNNLNAEIAAAEATLEAMKEEQAKLMWVCRKLVVKVAEPERPELESMKLTMNNGNG